MKKSISLSKIIIVFLIFSLLLNGDSSLVLKKGRSESSGDTKSVILPRKKSSIASKDDPSQRINYDLKRYGDPKTGNIPKGIRLRELQFSQKINHGDHLLRVSDLWDHRGPYNVGGRTRALAVKQSNSNIILAAGVSGGVWRSADRGETWFKSTGSSDLHSVSSIVEDTTNTGTWYYTTGEYLGSSASETGAFYRGDGVYKSTDDGRTWSVLSSTQTNSVSFDNVFDYCFNVKVNPTNSDVFVAAYSTIKRSTNGGTSFATELNSGTFTNLDISSTGVMYATLTNGSSAAIYRSTDGDTWTNITPGSFPSNVERVVLDIAPSDENVVYFLGNTGSGGSSAQHILWKYTYVSGDGSGSGGTWVDRSANLPDYDAGSADLGELDSQNGYDLVIAVKPDDGDVVFIGGTNLYRSEDGFATGSDTDPTVVDNTRWIGGYSTNNDISQYANHHADQHSIAFLPDDADAMIVGHDGGLSITYDNMSNIAGDDPVEWTSLNNGYITTQFYAIAIDNGVSSSSDQLYDFVMGGMQDNGTWSVNSTATSAEWTSRHSGDGGYCAVADNDGYNYRSWQNGVLYRYSSSESNSNWTRVDGGFSGTQFITPFSLDPNDNRIMYYAGSNTIYRHDDVTSRSISEQSANTGWNNLTTTTLSGGYEITNLAVSTASSSNIVYYGAYQSGSAPKIYKITNANTGTTPTVTDLSSGTNWPTNTGMYINCIAIDPADASNTLVVFSNYGVKSIYQSSDGGTTFSDVSGNLEEFSDGTGDGPSVRWAAISNHSELETYFVGTSTGLYSTSTLSGTSTTWDQEGGSNLGNVVVNMVKIRENDGLIAVGTHANGVYSYRPVSSSDPEIAFDLSSYSLQEGISDDPPGGGCIPYRDVTVWMKITNPPTGDATVTLSTSTSTATEGTDFDYTTNGSFSSSSSEITFADGSTDSKSFTVRIYDDPYEDGSEDVIFQYSITGTTDAIAAGSNQTCTITINDDDSAPSAEETVYLFQEDFESGITGWSLIAFGGHDGTTTNWWNTGTAISINGNSAYLSEGSGLSSYQKIKANQFGLRTSVIDATGYSDLELAFDFICDGEAGTDYGRLFYSLESAPSTLVPISGEIYQGVSTATTRSITLPSALDDETFRLSWFWFSNTSGGTDPALVIDDVAVTTTVGESNIECDLSATAEEYLGPNATVHFYDESSGELMTTITNLSSHDYGCTTISIDRAGSSASESWNSGSDKQFADKTVRIIPTTNNASGSYDITFYYTTAEIAGWETATSKDTSDLVIAKTSESMADISSSTPGSGNVISATASVESFGVDYKITARFNTGFSGFGIGDPGSPPPEALPVELMTFTGLSMQDDVVLRWTSISEVNTDYYSIERSTNGIAFDHVGAKKAYNEGEVVRNYSFVDRGLLSGHYYFRLKMIDFDGTFEYSDVIRVEHGFIEHSIVSIYPNPVADRLNIAIPIKLKGKIEMSILDIGGHILKTQKWNVTEGVNQTSINIQGLKRGLYILQFENEHLNEQLQFVVR